ncbi:hypothetical protein, partial [Enterobacter roggenkampii]|uniref:hypothetical protein n=1 Tax=Enterobacter roggenkampii TaxID=1812935 RepID=UPI0032AFE9A0
NGGKNSLNRLIRCVCGKKIGPDPRNFNQRVSLGRNDLLIRTFPKFTRLAILAGGVKVANTDYAKDYGVELLRAGFSELPPGSTLIAGDVAVIQPYPGGNGIGHMTMYDGTQWISDFVQKSMYPGPGYRKMQPSFKIYRMH